MLNKLIWIICFILYLLIFNEFFMITNRQIDDNIKLSLVIILMRIL